jgi:hypothetical protein
MIAFAPSLSRMRSHHWVTGVTILVSVSVFYGLLFESVKQFGNRFGPRLHDIEQTGPQ